MEGNEYREKENDTGDNLFIVAYQVTKIDILTWTQKLGIPLNQVTDEAIEMLKDKIKQGTSDWRKLFESMVKEAIKCTLDVATAPDVSPEYCTSFDVKDHLN